jgi:two-component system sensor histidine kinase ChvG
MAVETQRSPAVARVSAARLREAPKELLAGIGSFARWLGGTAPVRYAGLALAPVARLARWLRLYEFMTSGPLIRFVSNSLQRRIIFANLIGLAILLGGIFYLNQRPSWLIEEKRDRLRTQGQMIAAAIAANASVETGRIMLDPERLPEIEGARSPFRDDAFAALPLSIAPERVTLVLKKMVQTADTRARVYGQDGTLIADTAELLVRGHVVQQPSPSEAPPVPVGRTKIKNAWTRFLSWLLRGELPVYREIGGANGKAYPEVRMALSGSTTPMLLVNDSGEQIVSVAVPIQYRRAVQGVLLVSTRPGEIDEILAEERNTILGVALLALTATLLASLLLARTIAGPMRRLSAAAKNVSRNINARHELPELARRADEVGQMAAAFREMTASLYRRIESSERFAGEVAHELKNPLTAARSTAEALAYAKTPEMQQKLVGHIQEELKRLNKLITDVSNVTRLDARLAFDAMEPVDIRQVLLGVMDVFRDRLSATSCRLVLDIAEEPNRPDAYIVLGHDARLARVFTNLLDNAISFSPENATVTVRGRCDGNEIEITVDDEGPGIPEGQLETIFSRFYSDRPQTDHTIGKNSGLGLSISRDIVNAYGGRIWASNRAADTGANAAPKTCTGHDALRKQREPGAIGARFTLRLPIAGTPAFRGARALGRRI